MALKDKCVDSAIPKEDKEKGIPDSDLLIYIYTTHMEENIKAYAGPCSFDTSTVRPTVIGLTINTKFLATHMTTGRWQFWVDILIHELIHALGFTTWAMENIWPGGTPLRIGNDRLLYTHFLVTDYAKEYYKCEFVKGVPLENDGGKGAAHDHWERTAFGNEAMTASSISGPVFSKFTFLVLEGTTWYKPNFEYA